jgi:hypothetical protein
MRYQIAGHEFVVQDQFAQAARLVLRIRDFVGEAFKASPEASLAWAGVCLILPILTNPSAAEQANSDGFTYVTARMRFYVALEPMLLPKDHGEIATVPEDLKKEFEDRILDLYQSILDFQFRSVLRFYRKWIAKLGRDLIQHEDWNGMLFRVKELEKAVDDDFKKINDSAARKQLENLSKNADGFVEAMKILLSVTEQQLEVEKEGLQVQKEMIKVTEDIRYERPLVARKLS